MSPILYIFDSIHITLLELSSIFKSFWSKSRKSLHDNNSDDKNIMCLPVWDTIPEFLVQNKLQLENIKCSIDPILSKIDTEFGTYSIPEYDIFKGERANIYHFTTEILFTLLPHASHVTQKTTKRRKHLTDRYSIFQRLCYQYL